MGQWGRSSSADLGDGDYFGRELVDILVRSRPELIQSIHESFLAVGADAIETNTFANPRVPRVRRRSVVVGLRAVLEAAEAFVPHAMSMQRLIIRGSYWVRWGPHQTHHPRAGDVMDAESSRPPGLPMEASTPF